MNRYEHYPLDILPIEKEVNASFDRKFCQVVGDLNQKPKSSRKIGFLVQGRKESPVIRIVDVQGESDWKAISAKDRRRDLDDMLTHAEMCRELGISPKTGYDWRNPKSERYNADLAGIAIYLSRKTVRFRRGDVQAFAAGRKQGVKL